VDVVVGRWRNELDARCRVAESGDFFAHLVAGQLPTLAGLGALRDLDLQLIGVDQVVDGYAKSARGYLLDRRAPLVLKARGILTALSGVGLSAEAIHGDRECGMCFSGDGT